MNDITGIILAGGDSKRVGEDKAFLEFGDKLLIEVVIDKMLGIFNEVILVTNNSAKFSKYGERLIIKEDILEKCGPIGGIYTGLVTARNESVFAVACDMPFIDEKLMSLIIGMSTSADAVIPKYGGKTHSLFGVYSKKCIDVMKEQIEGGNYKMRDFLSKISVKILDENIIKEIDPRGRSLTNINTYGEYQDCLIKCLEKLTI